MYSHCGATGPTFSGLRYYGCCQNHHSQPMKSLPLSAVAQSIQPLSRVRVLRECISCGADGGVATVGVKGASPVDPVDRNFCRICLSFGPIQLRLKASCLCQQLVSSVLPGFRWEQPTLLCVTKGIRPEQVEAALSICVVSSKDSDRDGLNSAQCHQKHRLRRDKHLLLCISVTS